MTSGNLPMKYLQLLRLQLQWDFWKENPRLSKTSSGIQPCSGKEKYWWLFDKVLVGAYSDLCQVYSTMQNTMHFLIKQTMFTLVAVLVVK